MKRALLFCLVAMLVLAAPASAETFTVNTTADTQVAGGCDTVPQCSLRDAISQASGADGNVVMIPAGTYELNTPAVLGDLSINADMTITGAGARSTIIDANGASRVFANSDDADSASINGLTVTGGVSDSLVNPGNGDAFNGDGGGILAVGPLTLTDVTVRGNRAALGGGGIFAEPIEDLGPPVSQPLTLIRTTVSGNDVNSAAPGNGQGGGIAAFGDLTATNSTIHGNSVTKMGANEGGGIVSTNGLTKLVSTTITGNSIASAAGFGGGVSLDNAGVPPFLADLEATNTIIAGNTANGAEDDCGLDDVTPVTDNNISGDDTCGFTDPGSKEDTDPQLYALRNNAGPTDTRNFPLTSPALDTGTATGCPSTDQRGQPRPQRGTCDIGAVELAPPSAVTNGASRLSPTSTNVFGTSGNPLIAAGSAAFEFGTTTGYGSKVLSGGTVSTRQAGSTSGVAAQSTEAESAALTGLAANTTYHYRLVVQNADGIAFGADATFLTPSNAAPKRLSRPTASVSGVPGSCVRRAFTLRVRARVSSGTRLKAVRVTLDGRTLKRSTRGSFTVRVNAGPLRSGRHTLRIKAADRGNRTRTVTRRFRRCARVPVAEPRFTG